MTRQGMAWHGTAWRGEAGMDIDKLIEEARARIYAYINRVIAQKLRRLREKQQ